jgi:hypothetical protein
MEKSIEIYNKVFFGVTPDILEKIDYKIRFNNKKIFSRLPIVVSIHI